MLYIFHETRGSMYRGGKRWWGGEVASSYLTNTEELEDVAGMQIDN